MRRPDGVERLREKLGPSVSGRKPRLMCFVGGQAFQNRVDTLEGCLFSVRR